MKKTLILIPILFFYNCISNCDADCDGFDVNTPIYEWFLFPSNDQEIKFYDINNNIKILEQTFKTTTEARTIEHSCFSVFTSNDCDERISATYTCKDDTFIKISNDIALYEQDTNREDYITDSDIRLNADTDIDLSLYYNNDMLAYNTRDEYDTSTIELTTLESDIINNKTYQDIAVIRISDAYIASEEYEGFTKIWIQKNNGLVAFELNNVVWTK